MLTMMLGGLFSSLLARGPEGGGSASGSGISAGAMVAKLVEASSLRLSLLDPGRSMIQVEVDCDPSSILRIAAEETSRYPVTVVRILLKEQRFRSTNHSTPRKEERVGHGGCGCR